jgi:hypothetical protein
MHVIEREFFNLVVIAAPLPEVVALFRADRPSSLSLEPASLVFPLQPYSATERDLPMLLWSPNAAPGLTAFMPHVQSGDYFVIKYALERFGLSVATGRSASSSAEWPITEFIAYSSGKQRRIVRAMRDDPRWDFFADGDALPFEKTENYRRRLIKDRFVRDDLLQYFECWGAPVRDPAFWQGEEGMTFVRRTSNPTFQRTASPPLN